MGLHTTDAIVLRHYHYRETSALVSCLTDRFGKIKGLIKGLRGPQPSRYRSPMEPLTVNRIVFYDSRTSSLHLISQCDLLANFQEFSMEWELMRTAASCVELADAVLEVDDPQPAVYQLLRSTLQRLSTDRPEERAATRIHFVLRMLRLVGFQPQLDQCAGCSQAAMSQGFWSAGQGGIICESCRHLDPNADLISHTWLDELRACSEADQPHILHHLRAKDFQDRLDEFLRWRIDRPLKTLARR
ncbi:MAG: DNA repair protein RecO [Candidatus Omnitrophica bacterium]|nr:DNA repair protein RecO [Candidatus Omnitrophota bacterium]